MGKRSEKVAVICAVCQKCWDVKPSRAAQNNAITCSRECLSVLRSRNQVRHHGSEGSRSGSCVQCGGLFVRKPSQLTKYVGHYCSNTCRRAANPGIIAAQDARRNGSWHSCHRCDLPVWRTPGTLRSHVFCSRACAAVLPAARRGPRVARINRVCVACGTTFHLLPSHAARPGRRFCSSKCAAVTIQGAKRGLPGAPWPRLQRLRLTETLLRKYRNEWVQKRYSHSRIMSGSGNPQWRDGSATRPYAPGWTERVKLQIAKRDHYRCQLCGAPRRPGTHVVHHRDFRKTDHSLANLVLLCRHCHGKVHTGQVPWMLPRSDIVAR